MNSYKDIRWKQRFENFEKVFQLLEEHNQEELNSKILIAGYIQFFEMTMELSWKVMKDYLEAEGYIVKSPRETIKQAYQNGIINDGHIWLEALNKRNLTTHTYDDDLALTLISEINKKYFPEIKWFYEKLKRELL
ncbi:nucleotidyltransferase substrate binding protein [Alkalibacillus haloalkaliphilus]|uniref:Nucleotidyltransferase n=1 Tax=Alkalibacillus haloalkaliphilus TaxID=94136 RepID=A0A511W5M6_9BACI|nr:nucleotidyltransferase substrate binding protein [Alkalibacillus haloalkaliphilus]GEN46404.1 nucleotidyltransferase [Alkalibacillus haloalkaliphilus]